MNFIFLDSGFTFSEMNLMLSEMGFTCLEIGVTYIFCFLFAFFTLSAVAAVKVIVKCAVLSIFGS